MLNTRYCPVGQWLYRLCPFHFSFCASVWVVNTAMTSSSWILSDVVSNLLLSWSGTFFISYISQHYKFHLVLYKISLLIWFIFPFKSLSILKIITVLKSSTEICITCYLCMLLLTIVFLLIIGYILLNIWILLPSFKAFSIFSWLLNTWWTA